MRRDMTCMNRPMRAKGVETAVWIYEIWAFLVSFWFRDIPGSVMVLLDVMQLAIDKCDLILWMVFCRAGMRSGEV